MLPPDAHIAAKSGQLVDLERELKERRFAVLTERDDQGWQVLHQGVAGGNEEVVKLLVSNGAEINSRTHGGYGDTIGVITHCYDSVRAAGHNFTKTQKWISHTNNMVWIHHTHTHTH
jgi:ankyrin repeat protein